MDTASAIGGRVLFVHFILTAALLKQYPHPYPENKRM